MDKKLNRDTKDYTVYIVDDMDVMLRLVANSLKDFTVKSFNNPKTALNEIIKNPPDIVVTDVEMPDINGFQLCRAIKTREELKTLPVIFLTSLDQGSALAEALDSGGIDFIDKNKIKGDIVKLRVINALKLKEFAQAGIDSAVETTKFLRVIAHDIANPLSVVKAYSSILKKKVSKTEYADSYEKIFAKVENALFQVETILDDVRSNHARAEKGEKLVVENVSIKSVIVSAVYLAQEKAENKGINLTVEPIPEDLKVIAHRGVLQNQVLGNLISNAVKFTQREGTITITTELSGSDVFVSIIDDGVGMPESLVEKIFDPSENTNRPGTENERGTGFGLPIVKDYIEQMGGTIKVKSLDINDLLDTHGSTFTVCLKKAVG